VEAVAPPNALRDAQAHGVNSAISGRYVHLGRLSHSVRRRRIVDRRFYRRATKKGLAKLTAHVATSESVASGRSIRCHHSSQQDRGSQRNKIARFI
jgi:hypothetical protein